MNFLKGAVIFIVGSMTGATCTFIFLKEKYEKALEDELNDLRGKYLEEKEKSIEKEEVDDIIRDEGYISYESMSEKEVRTHVNKIAENVIKKDNPPEDYADEPFEITESDFSERELYFDKIEVDYYLDDGALVSDYYIVDSDENSTLLNVDDTIGYENLDKFINSDREMMFIRNPSLATDYQVTKVSGKYSDILGLGGDDEED